MSERLRNAAQEGDLELVLQALESGEEPDEEDEDGVTALMLASEHGRLEVIKALLALGADTDSADANGVTALMRAAWKGHVEAVRLLIEGNAIIDVVDNDGATALHYAALGGDPEASADPRFSKHWFTRCSVIYQIINVPRHSTGEYGEVEPVDSAGWTPLMIAAAAGHINAVRILLGLGSRPDFSAGYDKTPLSLALEGGHTDVVRVLEEEAAGARRKL